MLSDNQKRKLAEDFFEDRGFPSSLAIEEEKYIKQLSQKWSKSLLQIYGDIMEADRKHGVSSNEQNEYQHVTHAECKKCTNTHNEYNNMTVQKI